MIGATFARGSCRALRWAVFVGAILALGVGQASAQTVTMTVEEEVSEGSMVDVTITARVDYDLGMPTADETIEVTFTAAPTSGTNDAEPEDYALPAPVTLTFEARAATAPAEFLVATETVQLGIREDPGDAEDEEFTLNARVTTDTPGSKFSGVTITGSAITIKDDQDQRFRLVNEPTTVKEGDTIPAMSVEPVYPIDDETYDVGVRLVDPAMVASGLTPTTATTMNTGTQSVAVNLMLEADDGNTDEDQVTIEVIVGSFGSTTVHDTAVITVTDKTPAGPSTGDLTFTPATRDDIVGLVVGTAIAPVQLPTVTTGVGTAPYMYAATGLPAGLMVSATGMLSGTPTAAATAATVTYTATDNTSPTPLTGSLTFNITVMATPTTPTPTPTGGRGQIEEFTLVGDVVDKTIAGSQRHHVPEGSQGVDLSVTVQWTHEEIALIGYYQWQTINVEIMSDEGVRALPNWLSWIDDDGQDVHFPRTAGATGVVRVRTPRITEIPTAELGSPRHVKSRTGTLDILLIHDDHEAENDAFYIEATGGDVALGTDTRRAYAVRTLDVVIEDDEDQTVRIRNSKPPYLPGPTNVYEPAGDPEITNPLFIVDAVPPRSDLPLEVRLDMVDLDDQTVSAAQISLDKASMTLNEDGDGTSNSEWVTVHLPASDGNRMDDGYKLNASVNVYSVATGGYRTIPVAEHVITVIDRHKLPSLSVSPATAMVEEGGKTELTLTINRNPANTIVGSSAVNSSDKEKRQYTDEEVDVMLTMGAGSTAAAADFSVLTNPVTFPERVRGSFTATMTVEVMATEDRELDDGEMLVLDAMVAGTVAVNGTDKDPYAGVSTLTIEEGTTKLVYPKTDEEIQTVIYAAKEAGMGDMMFNPGEMIEIESAGALFNAAEGVTLSYSAMSDNDDVATVAVSGAMVTVTAGDMPGVMAHITITAHASMPSGAKSLPQTDPREASVIFPVEVGLAALSIMLSGPDDMNLAEGGMGGMVTATANRMVTADTMVTLMRDRSKSSADDMDFEAEPITILAGQMSGSTMVMAVEDDMMEDMEELVLYGMTEGMEGEVTGEVMFYLWDAAVPALPIIAQLLLAAFLAFGGYRRYRRR